MLFWRKKKDKRVSSIARSVSDTFDAFVVDESIRVEVSRFMETGIRVRITSRLISLDRIITDADRRSIDAVTAEAVVITKEFLTKSLLSKLSAI
jgi:3-oxoacyl-(acyl-carrier-protein) synthase